MLIAELEEKEGYSKAMSIGTRWSRAADSR